MVEGAGGLAVGTSAGPQKMETFLGTHSHVVSPSKTIWLAGTLSNSSLIDRFLIEAIKILKLVGQAVLSR